MIGLTAATPRWNVFGGLDFKEVSNIVDQVVIRIPLPTEPGPIISKLRLECLIHKMLRDIPSYKILLRIPVYAMKWTFTESEVTSEILSHSAAMSQVFVMGQGWLRIKIFVLSLSSARNRNRNSDYESKRIQPSAELN